MCCNNNKNNNNSDTVVVATTVELTKQPCANEMVVGSKLLVNVTIQLWSSPARTTQTGLCASIINLLFALEKLLSLVALLVQMHATT